MSVETTLQKVTAYIEDGLANNRWSQGERLPTTLMLSRKLRVNIVTLGKALKLLAAKGVITIVHRKGIYAGKGPVFDTSDDHVPATRARASAWRRIRTRIEHDLYNSVFTTTLPDNSELQKHYGVCYQTIRKALTTLTDDGVLICERNRYLIRAKIDETSSSSILSISNSTSSSIASISLFDDFIKTGIAALEMLGSRNNLKIIKKSINPQYFEAVIKNHIQPDSHFGYIIWTCGIADTILAELLEALSRLRKPTVLIDENDGFSMPVRYKKNPVFRILNPASYLAGKCVARHLMQNGHTKCAFISYSQHQKWARARLDGVTQSFADAGCINSVIPIVSEGNCVISSSYVNKVHHEMANLFPASVFWYVPTLQLDGLETTEYVCTHILGGDLFPRALRDTTITAWICENDFVALAAMHYLKTTQPPHVQKRIAIIGFDDLPAATENDLTSYNFAPSLIMEKAVGFLINPRQEFFKDKMRIEVEGVLIERGSTVK